MLVNAVLALIMVLATHEWIEGLLIRDCKELHPKSVVALTLMRSHGSLRKMWALIRGYRWENGAYHGPSCRCHLRDNPGSMSPTCPLSGRHIDVSRRLLFTTLFVRAVIIIVEVIAIVLAINLTTEKEVTRGAAAITPISNNFGEPRALDRRLGCEPIFRKPDNVLTEHLNRITQLTVCTRLHRPFEAMSNFTPAPRGYEAFFLYIDLSGDKVTLSHANKKLTGAEMYAYWSVECSENNRDPKNNSCNGVEVAEGVVATVVHGKQYSKDRTGGDTVNSNRENQEKWRRQLDAYLKKRFPDAYRTAYPANATSWVDTEQKRPHPVPRMLLHFNVTALQSLDPDPNTRIGSLLQQIVGLQFRTDRKENLIVHSDGIVMIREPKPVLEYRIKQPIIGSVLWAILLSFALLIRWVLGVIFPNNVYELIMEKVRREEEQSDRSSNNPGSSWGSSLNSFRSIKSKSNGGHAVQNQGQHCNVV